MAEEIKIDDVALSVDRGDGLVSRVNPDKLCFALCGLFLDPGGVRLAIFLTTENVSRAINDPSDGGIFSVSTAEFVHAHGGSADKVGPPTIMAITLDAKILPFAERRAAAQDDVFLC